ncbi:MAG: PAS domain-containing sensor histidine kinase, partial [Promethearchaeota archaeon]
FKNLKTPGKDTTKNFSFRIMTKDGKVKWLESIHARINFKGRLASLIILVDNTERMEAQFKLEESEARFRHVFEKSRVGIVILTNKGKVLEYNPTFSKIFGVEGDALIGEKIDNLIKYVTRYKEMMQHVLRRVRKQNRVDVGELYLRNIENKEFIVALNSNIFRTSNMVYKQVVIHDITEQKKLEQILEDENEKLKQLNNMRKFFIQSAVHDLRTPLVSIYSASEMLLKIYEKELGENAKKIAKMIFLGSKKMNVLINKMLDVALIESNQMSLNIENVDLVKITRDCIDIMEYLINSKNQKLILNLPEKAELVGDKMRLEEVVMNLLSNAVKNTPSAGKITITISKKENAVTFSIEDTGIGLTEREKSEIFTQYGKIDRKIQSTDIDTKGSGLGLFITKNIIKEHGGEIWAESKGRNEGSKFSFVIPIKKEQEDEGKKT